MISDISKYKTFILIIGMLAGLGIVVQPVLGDCVDCATVCKVKSVHGSEDSKSTDEKSPQEQVNVSVLEAIAPTAQIHISPVNFVVEKENIISKPTLSKVATLLVQLPEKLLKVLFNILIAPNAP